MAKRVKEQIDPNNQEHVTFYNNSSWEEVIYRFKGNSKTIQVIMGPKKSQQGYTKGGSKYERKERIKKELSINERGLNQHKWDIPERTFQDRKPISGIKFGEWMK